MSVRNTTTEGKTALFDSTTGLAFGPLFDSYEDADDFLCALAEHDGRDARQLTTAELLAFYQAWEMDR